MSGEVQKENSKGQNFEKDKKEGRNGERKGNGKGKCKVKVNLKEKVKGLKGSKKGLEGAKPKCNFGFQNLWNCKKYFSATMVRLVP